jgi:hypothetical protein
MITSNAISGQSQHRQIGQWHVRLAASLCEHFRRKQEHLRCRPDHLTIRPKRRSQEVVIRALLWGERGHVVDYGRVLEGHVCAPRDCGDGIDLDGASYNSDVGAKRASVDEYAHSFSLHGPAEPADLRCGRYSRDSLSTDPVVRPRLVRVVSMVNHDIKIHSRVQGQ